jgi:hypothetical protein
LLHAQKCRSSLSAILYNEGTQARALAESPVPALKQISRSANQNALRFANILHRPEGIAQGNSRAQAQTRKWIPEP